MNFRRLDAAVSRNRAFLVGAGIGALLWGAEMLVRRARFGSEHTLDLVYLLVSIIVILVMGSAFDLAFRARRKNEDLLRKLSRAVQQSPSVVMITDRQGRIEYVNPKFTEVTGYTLDEVRGQNPRILKSGDTSAEEYERMWQTITAGGEWRGDFHNVKKNGEQYWESASISAIKNVRGEITHFLSVKEDITARKAAEAAERVQRSLAESLYQQLQDYAAQLEERVAARTMALEQHRHQLEMILDAMDDSVIHLEKGSIRYVNQAFTRMFGYERKDLPSIASSALQLVTPGITLSTLDARAAPDFEQGRPWRSQLRMKRKSGEEFDVAVTSVLLVDAQEPTTVTVLRDISREQALQAQKERFLTHAAHELRTPISNIKTRLYLLRQQPDKLPQHIEVMEQAANNIHQLVEDLMDLLRLGLYQEALVRRAVDMRQIVQDAVASRATEASRTQVILSCQIPEHTLTICADQRRLSQAISRLISYAIYSTPPEAGVTITLDLDPISPTGDAVLRVHSQGAWVETTEFGQVFEPFYRASESNGTGVGLGLAVVRETVKMHNGSVEVTSEAGQSMTFTVCLPLSEDCPQ